MRLDVFLANRHAGEYTRSQILNFIKSGLVTVNSQIVTKAGHFLHPDDQISLSKPPKIAPSTPENIPLDIVFDDPHLMIINKPRGLVVHPGAGQKSGTLLNGLLSIQEDEGLDRAGIVHRLDKNTAGLMIVAKTAQVQAKLSKMFENREVERKYWGIVDGVLAGEGTINRNIIRDPNFRTIFKTSENSGRTAITHYKVLEAFAKHTLVEFRLETGRTHQIRVHCKSISRPIVGDPEYNPRGSLKCTGQMLESVALEFSHPITGERIAKTTAPTAEFRQVLAKIARLK